jgi:hypothetical protein
MLFNTDTDHPLEPNVLALRIQPDEHVQAWVKVHGSDDGAPLIHRMRIARQGGGEHPAGSADYHHEGHHIRHFPSDPSLHPSSIPAPKQRLEQILEQMVAAQLAHRAGDALFTEAIAISGAMARVMKSDGAASLAGQGSQSADVRTGTDGPHGAP